MAAVNYPMLTSGSQILVHASQKTVLQRKTLYLFGKLISTDPEIWDLADFFSKGPNNDNISEFLQHDLVQILTKTIMFFKQHVN